MQLKFRRIRLPRFSLISYIFIKIFGRILIKDDSKAVQLYRNVWKSMLVKQDKESSSENRAIRPFRISTPEDVLQDLNERLLRTRIKTASGKKRGISAENLHMLVSYWLTKFNWRKTEKELNEYPQFKTNIEGCDIHFMHVRPRSGPEIHLKVIPLLMIHGWPGSCSDFRSVVPQLTHQRDGCDFVFEIVCPSLPGCGFSDSFKQDGFKPSDAARILVILMERLEISHFYVHGHGWGSVTASLIARYYPYRVKGLHVDKLFSIPRELDTIVKAIFIQVVPYFISAEERPIFLPMRRKLRMLKHHFRNSICNENPGCPTFDSPAELAERYFGLYRDSYMANESFQSDDLPDKCHLDYFLSSITITWINNNFSISSKYILKCKEEVNKRLHEKLPLTVPCGIAFFPDDPTALPQCIIRDTTENLVSYSVLPSNADIPTRQRNLYDHLWKFVKLVEEGPRRFDMLS